MLTNPTIHTDVARLRHADVLDEAATAHRAGARGRDRQDLLHVDHYREMTAYVAGSLVRLRD